MKNKNILWIICSFVMLGCNNSNNNNNIIGTNDHTATMLYSTTELENEEEQPSEKDSEFDNALEALNIGDHETPANYILNSIEYLNQENDELSVKKQHKITQTITALKKIERLIRSPSSENIAKTTEALAFAELITAKEYLALSKFYSVEEPERAYGDLDYAIDKIGNTLYILEGPAITDINKLFKNCKSIQQNEDIQSDSFSKAIQESINKLSTWLDTHNLYK